MQYCNGAVAVVKTLVLFGGACMLFAGAGRASAVDNVEVMVCPAANESSFSVVQPQSDSIVDEPKLTVAGEVVFISQIDFFIDDVYNNTVALGYSETGFSTILTLPPGTHTLKFVATDSCSQTVHETSLVVTYEPKTPPSIGENVDTEVDGRVTPGVPVGVVPTPEKNIIEKTIDRFVVPPYESVKKVLDIGNPAVVDPEVRAGNVTRTILFATGGILALSAVHIGALSAAALPDRLVSLLPFRRRAMTAIALLGLALMVLVFIV